MILCARIANRTPGAEIVGELSATLPHSAASEYAVLWEPENRGFLAPSLLNYAGATPGLVRIHLEEHENHHAR